jgi:hypothetical protein
LVVLSVAVTVAENERNPERQSQKIRRTLEPDTAP